MEYLNVYKKPYILCYTKLDKLGKEEVEDLVSKTEKDLEGKIGMCNPFVHFTSSK